MANEDYEDVIFENSPLEKYLKEAGFVDIELEKVDRPDKQEGETYQEHTVDNSCGLKNSILNLYKKYLLLDSDHLLSARQKYASIVINSGTLSEDDYTFLHQFDPELFDISEEVENKKERSQMFSLHKWMPENLVPILFLLVSVLLGSNYWEYICDYKGACLGALLIMTFTVYYMWNLQSFRALHKSNMQVLNNYTNEVKSFVNIFRKSVMLIQELELISKGYTLVGLGMQIGYQQSNSKGDFKRDIYPKLRQSLFDNGMSVLTRSCSSAEKMFASIPFASEVNGVFTCISSNPLSQFGLEECTQSEKLSLQYLKVLLSVIASQQSEFLSRFLLSLSEKTKLSEISFDIKSFQRFLSGFYDQLEVVTKAIKSIQLSYHLHKSALTFTGDHHLPHDSISSRPQSKWTQYYTSVHSLELHLKACLTRIQFINTFITTETESEELTSSLEPDHSGNYSAMCIKELESAYNLLKNELESAICCWEEGFYNLKLISGIEKSENLSMKEEIEEEDPDQDSNFENQMSVKEPEEVIGDCVFEGYTNFDDDFDFQQTILTREELDKESRTREESQHLLQELKNVLLTKNKDPLITDAGFVEPNKSQNKQENSRNELSSEREVELLDNKIDLCSDSNINTNSKGDSNFAESVADATSDNLSIIKKKNGECSIDHKKPLSIETKQSLPCSQWPSKAFSFAIQEAARSRGNALMEESYGSSDSD